MKQLLNEFKRMQQLAGVLNENQKVKYDKKEYYVVASANDNDLNLSELSAEFKKANTTEETFYILSSEPLKYGQTLSTGQVKNNLKDFKIVDGRDVISI